MLSEINQRALELETRIALLSVTLEALNMIEGATPDIETARRTMLHELDTVLVDLKEVHQERTAALLKLGLPPVIGWLSRQPAAGRRGAHLTRVPA